MTLNEALEHPDMRRANERLKAVLAQPLTLAPDHIEQELAALEYWIEVSRRIERRH